MLKENKSFQFLVGAFVLFLAWKCYTLGVFDWLFADDDAEGFQSVNLLALVATAAVSAVQLVGVCAILLVSGLQPLAEKAVDYLRGLFPRASKAADKVESVIDAAKLNEALTNLDNRINALADKIEGKK